MAISVNMLGLRFTTDAQARSKNGHPARNTTGVASARPIQFTTVPYVMTRRPPPAMSAMVTATTGAASNAAIQNRLVMSTSSGLGVSSALTVRGSSAIPQIGHDPGASRTICGCIGHVYSTFVSDAGSERLGSNAMPHLGHTPGCDERTSVSIGQTKAAPAAGGDATVAAGSRNCFGSSLKRSRQLGLQK